jgi:hypothetical protein
MRADDRRRLGNGMRQQGIRRIKVGGGQHYLKAPGRRLVKLIEVWVAKEFQQVR